MPPEFGIGIGRSNFSFGRFTALSELRSAERARDPFIRGIGLGAVVAVACDRGLCENGCFPISCYVCASSHVDNFAAVYESATLKQIGGFDTPKAPMGFGFAADGERAYLCCHDAAITLEFELASGRITRQFPTAAGCEFILSY